MEGWRDCLLPGGVQIRESRVPPGRPLRAAAEPKVPIVQLANSEELTRASARPYLPGEDGVEHLGNWTPFLTGDTRILGCVFLA